MSVGHHCVCVCVSSEIMSKLRKEYGPTVRGRVEHGIIIYGFHSTGSLFQWRNGKRGNHIL